MDAMGYDVTDFMPCECCGVKAVDTHHIKARGVGSSKKRDVIENLMGLCRECHENLGDRTYLRKELYDTHRAFLEANGVPWNQDNIAEFYDV